MWKYLFAIAICLTPIGCNAVAQENLNRSQYKPISIDNLDQVYHLTPNIHPREVAERIFDDYFEQYGRETEGRQAETYQLEYPEPGQALITVEIVGLADDSVRGQRFRYLMAYNEQTRQWEFIWAGSQVKCYRGHQDWSAELCS